MRNNWAVALGLRAAVCSVCGAFIDGDIGRRHHLRQPPAIMRFTFLSLSRRFSFAMGFVWVLAAGAAETAAGRVAIDFGANVRTWDGFGLNYVEGGHTADPERDYQDYGGFSRLGEATRQEVMDLLFGPVDGRKADDGLRVGLHKIFLDPHHQAAVAAPFVGASASTAMSRYFLFEAAKRLKARGRSIEVVTTYYGVPAWATSTGKFHWRDMNPDRAKALADYMTNWIAYLRGELAARGFAETVRIRAASLTNEGEARERWNEDGSPQPKRDYNLHWPSKTIAAFLPVLAESLRAGGQQQIALMPCETAGWDGLAEAQGDRIAATLMGDSVALKHIGLLGGHSFGRSGAPGAEAIAQFRRAKGDALRAWTTSHDWQKGDVAFAEHTRAQIYDIGVTGIITWAATKRLSEWQRYTLRPPNPQCAVLINEDGTTRVQSGYSFYKQFTRAGQPGMAVAEVRAEAGKDLRVAAFARNGTSHADAFVVINLGEMAHAVEVTVTGTAATRFRAHRTSGDASAEAFKDVGIVECSADGRLRYTSPPKAVTTFFGL